MRRGGLKKVVFLSTFDHLGIAHYIIDKKGFHYEETILFT